MTGALANRIQEGAFGSGKASQRLNEGFSRGGFTLVEVMVASFISILLIICVYNAIESAARGTRNMADHVAAYGLCRDRYEQMRGTAYQNIVPANFPTTNMTLTHLECSDSTPIAVTVSNVITELSQPVRKQIRIYASWEFLDRKYVEYLSGSIANHNASASKIGMADGKVFLNPNTEMVTQLRIVTEDGTVITQDDLNNNPNFSFVGTASSLSFQADGGGAQTDFFYDFRTQPLANGKEWDLSGDSMDISLDNHGGKWDVTIRGTGISLSSP